MLYRNPIIPGFAPDPSIVRIKDTFYLVNSSFHLFPGLPIYASRDLVAWRHIGNAITRPSQLSLAQSGTKLNPPSNEFGDKSPATGGLYAPTIRHQNGTTYIVCTNVRYTPERDQGDWVSGLIFENFIISTRGELSLNEWSDPVYFDFHGIDPDIFFDDDGRAFISGSSWTPSPSCCIRGFEIDVATGRKITPEIVLWKGYTGIIPEGPHIYKRNGYYYLLITKGGTHAGHCISIARAESIWGLYESCSENPILSPSEGADPSLFCQHNGHGDLVQDLNGAWWMVCLGVRRDRAGRMGLGRETFLAAVDWPDEQIWPRIQQPIPQVLQQPVTTGGNSENEEDACCPSSSARLSVSAESTPSPFSPKTDLVCIRDPDFSRCRVSQDSRVISLLPSSTDLGQCTRTGYLHLQPTSFIGRRIRRLQSTATVELRVSSSLKNIRQARLGLAYYKDEFRYARILYELGKEVVKFEVVNHAKNPPILTQTETSMSVTHSRTTAIQFRIIYTEKLIHFLYREGGLDRWDEWQSRGLVDTLDMTGDDFTGPVIGVLAIGEGEEWCNFENVDF